MKERKLYLVQVLVNKTLKFRNKKPLKQDVFEKLIRKLLKKDIEIIIDEYIAPY